MPSHIGYNSNRSLIYLLYLDFDKILREIFRTDDANMILCKQSHVITLLSGGSRTIRTMQDNTRRSGKDHINFFCLCCPSWDMPDPTRGYSSL